MHECMIIFLCAFVTSGCGPTKRALQAWPRGRMASSFIGIMGCTAGTWHTCKRGSPMRRVMTRRSGCARQSAAARVPVAQQVCRPVACADGRPGRREGRVRPPTGERDETADGPSAIVCGACGAPESHPVLGHRARIRSRYGTAPPSE